MQDDWLQSVACLLVSVNSSAATDTSVGLWLPWLGCTDAEMP
jgi:hypothetical protein